jgi:hypothetical protein
MLTESEVRDLLAKAAASIDVPADTPVLPGAVRRHRGWLMPVVAACCVGAVIAAGLLVARAGHPDGVPSTRPPDNPDSRHVIPTVAGLDRLTATRVLTAHGLRVTTESMPTCLPSGRAVRTRPANGSAFDPGGTVTLFVTRPAKPATSCADPEAAPIWQLLDYANGLGPAPRFALEVTVYADGRRTVMTGAAAARRTSWPVGSALALMAIAGRVEEHPGTDAPTPFLRFSRDDGTVCGGRRLPQQLSARPSQWFSFTPPPSDFISPACTFTNIYRTGGDIDALVVRQWRPTPTRTRSRMTAQQVAFAERIARSEIAKQHSHVRIAVAQLHPGSVRQSNTGHTCDSGTLLRVTLIGAFPHTVVSPVPGGNATVHVEVIEANPDSGQECLISVQTGRVEIPKGATTLPSIGHP